MCVGVGEAAGGGGAAGEGSSLTEGSLTTDAELVLEEEVDFMWVSVRLLRKGLLSILWKERLRE